MHSHNEPQISELSIFAQKLYIQFVMFSVNVCINRDKALATLQKYEYNSCLSTLIMLILNIWQCITAYLQFHSCTEDIQ